MIREIRGWIVDALERSARHWDRPWSVRSGSLRLGGAEGRLCSPSAWRIRWIVARMMVWDFVGCI